MINFKVFSLLESILEVDNKLIQVLDHMRSRGDIISKKIFPLIKKDIKTHVNYLRPSSPDDMFFIPDSQVDKTREKGEDLLWKGKNTTKVGRTWRQVLKDNNITFTDQEIETFVNNYKNAYKKIILNETSDTFKIVSGEAIRDWYDEDVYFKGGGSLNKSCMRYSECQMYLDIYVDNPEVCQLLILVEDDKLLGRALIWKIGESRYYLDRIYTRWDSDVDRFFEYFEEQYGSKLSYEDGYDSFMRVKLKKIKYNFFPYMDTFKYYNPKTFELYNSNDNDQLLYELESTDGEFSVNGEWSEHEDRYIPRSEAFYIERYGWVSLENTQEDGYSGERFLSDDGVDSVYGIIDKNDAVQVDVLEKGKMEWVPKDDLSYLVEGEKLIPVPYKWYINNHDTFQDPTVINNKDNKPIIIEKSDILKGFFGHDNIYNKEYNEENYPDTILLYKVDQIDSSIEWRGGNSIKIGLLNNIPIIVRYYQYYLMDEVNFNKFKEKYQILDKPLGFCDKADIVKILYCEFNPLIDKVEIEDYNLDEVDINYIKRDNLILKIYFEEGREVILKTFYEGIDKSINELNSIPSKFFEEIESKNISFFNQYSSFSRENLLQSVIIHNIFDDTINWNKINDFLRKKNLPVINYYGSSLPPISISYDIGYSLNRYLYKISVEDNGFVQHLLEKTFKEVKTFCSSNNL